MIYSIEYSDKARKFLSGLDKHLLARIFKRIERLMSEPVPSDAKFIGREAGVRFSVIELGIIGPY